MTTAVLVIDVQQALFDENPRPFEADKTVKKINQVTGQARNAGIPVIFIQHEQESGPLAYDSDGWKLQAGLVVKDTDLFVRKTTPDSFLRTDLKEILESNSVKNLIICGYASEFCVDTTTRRAAALGYSVQLVSDAHTTHDKEHATAKMIREHHNATLPNIKSFGPKITAVPSKNIFKR
ncbi:MAG: cysteine hydrolase [Desulfobacteraceae bacterium]|nr:cysteine hydrolase [Desulfobacteraceae bacterium]